MIKPLRPWRDTARGVVIYDGNILLMERWRPGMHYFSIPGGGIEAGETAEETVAREILEETTVRVRVERQILEMRDGKYRHQIYFCQYISGEPHMPDHAPEALHKTEENRFKPAWVEISRLPELPFTYWRPLQQPLIDGLTNGFEDQVKIVSAAPPS